MGFEEQLHDFEDRWQEKWQKEKIFEPEPDDREKFFITVAYPYPSGGMHIGHVRTYTLPDVFARYKRMQGKNVLFPMAWHVTGTPIIGAVQRLKDGEEKQIDVLTNTYNIPEEDLHDLETPMEYANYFIENSYKPSMKNLGFSVDWRREFTTNDKRYSKFIEWQYKSLKEKGLVKKGKHPTKYCTNDKNPVTTHDLLEGEDAEQQEYTLVKFRYKGKKIPMATLRPETVYGVTHALVNPEADYLQVKIDGEQWIVSEEASQKLEHQGHDIIVDHEIKGRDMVGWNVENPVNQNKVMILPATFVDPDSATGIVMSVPGHAPYDWISLKELQEDEELLKKYGLNVDRVKEIKPISIIDVEGYGEFPAKDAVEEYGITSQDEEEKLEKATEEVYKKEFHSGKLNEKCGDYSGHDVQSVKDRMKTDFSSQGIFGSMHDFSDEVVCRCGGKVIVAETDTWFLEYGNKGWKDKADALLDSMNVIPDGTRADYDHTINWLESWPCIRNYGLGTRLPFDEDFVVEPLSDSTIYMSYYTIKHLIEDIEPEKLTKEFFDYVFKGAGPAEKISKDTGIPVKKINQVKESFEYWYPLDWRTSANELIQNHLTFFMFHHAALFRKQHWPKGVATWGMGLLEGQKMSSSKGHVILPGKAIERHGADTVRFFMFSSCEPWQDFDWKREEVREAKKKLSNFYRRTLEMYGKGENREKTSLDRFVLSKLQKIVRDATEAMENFQTRKASLKAFFELNNIIGKYRNRSESMNHEVVKNLLDTQIRLMAPFIPHMCEQLWEETGHIGMVVKDEWPEPEEELIDDEIEYREETLQDTVKDIREISRLVEDYEKIQIAVATDWKRKAVSKIRDMFEEIGEIDIGKAMDMFTSDNKLREHAKEISEMLKDYKQNPGKLPDRDLDTREEAKIYRDSTDFISEEFDADVDIVPEDVSDFKKAGRALPGKPAIILR